MKSKASQYEDWFKLLWNACIDALDDTPSAEALDPDNPINGILETMHGIADGEREMWLQVPDGEPILNKYPDEPPARPEYRDPWPDDEDPPSAYIG
jgi:hypothetical protein